MINKCDQCKKRCLFPRKLVYKHPVIGEITSQDKVCRKCYNKMKKALDSEPRIK